MANIMNNATQASFPAFRDALIGNGYEVLRPFHPDAYGLAETRYTTYRLDGVRLAFSANRSLYVHRGTAIIYDDDDSAVIMQVITTDPALRRAGRATRAMEHVVAAADKAGIELFIHVAPLDKSDKITPAALQAFYGRFGFVESEDGRVVMSRKPKPVPEPEVKSVVPVSSAGGVDHSPSFE